VEHFGPTSTTNMVHSNTRSTFLSEVNRWKILKGSRSWFIILLCSMKKLFVRGTKMTLFVSECTEIFIPGTFLVSFVPDFVTGRRKIYLLSNGSGFAHDGIAKKGRCGTELEAAQLAL